MFDTPWRSFHRFLDKNILDRRRGVKCRQYDEILTIMQLCLYPTELGGRRQTP